MLAQRYCFKLWILCFGICTVYAFLARKCPDGFNETKHIGFTNYTAIVIWLAFVPLYIASTNYNIRMVTLAMSLSLSGFVQLSCLFLPKIYIILFTPEKNTKEVVMGHHHTTLHPANLRNKTPNNTSDNGYPKIGASPSKAEDHSLGLIYSTSTPPPHQKI